MLKIEFESNRLDYQPHDTIDVQVSWNSLPANANALSVRLIWFTQGKGDRDVSTVDEHEFGLGPHVDKGSKRFEFLAPSRPYSFSGTLIELTWAVEVVVLPNKDSDREAIFISPSGKPVRLDKKFEDTLSSRFVFRSKAGR